MSSSKQNKKFMASSRTNDSNRSKNASISKGSRIGGRNAVFAGGTVISSASKRYQGATASERQSQIKPLVQIYDELGNDVTPQPLLQMDYSLMMKKTQGAVIGDGSVATPTDLMSQTSASIYGTQPGTTATSVFGGGPFTRSVFTQSYDAVSDSIPTDEDGTPELTSFLEVRHKRQEVQEVPTQEDLTKIVDIILTETDTIWMLDLTDIKMSIESEEAADVKERNRVYAELQKSRAGNDLYAERGMNTFNNAPKLKSVTTQKIETNTLAVECTNWDMFDTYDALEKERKAALAFVSEEDEGFSEHSTHSEDEHEEQSTEAKEEGVEEEGTISQPTTPKEEEQTSAKPSSVASEKPSDKPELTIASSVAVSVAGKKKSISSERETTTRGSSMMSSEIQSSLDTVVELTDKEKLQQEWQSLLQSDTLRQHLFLMERVVNLNTYQVKQAQYRGFQHLNLAQKSSLAADINILPPESFKTVEPSEERSRSIISVHDMGPNLDRLWAYNCNLSRAKNASCIAWNKANPDLVAVGYGQFEFTQQKAGLVCCWCIKNPEFPERVYTGTFGVTALDFSKTNPNLLAVGYYDGGIAVYNVRKSTDEPVLDNFATVGKHLGPVWELKWIEKESGVGEEQTEVLISISTDGRVCQWSIRKGFESYDVMRLKRMPTRMGGRSREKKGEAFISRFAGGMCFDFYSKDSNIYLAGTEEGFIHKCSCSHNEQYLESYAGHTAPVYAVQWSPFLSDIFLSCSADWTIKLWHQDKTKPLLSFHSSTKAVNDVCWSPWSSTVFACVNEGAVEVWDLSQSTLDAVYTLNPTSGAKQSTVSFSKNSRCLLVGDSEGQVTVYELRCMPKTPFDQETALKDIMKASLASQLQSTTETEPEEEEDEDDEAAEN